MLEQSIRLANRGEALRRLQRCQDKIGNFPNIPVQFAFRRVEDDFYTIQFPTNEKVAYVSKDRFFQIIKELISVMKIDPKFIRNPVTKSLVLRDEPYTQKPQCDQGKLIYYSRRVHTNLYVQYNFFPDHHMLDTQKPGKIVRASVHLWTLGKPADQLVKPARS